ncbi:TPA: phage holin family protein, partial [Enterococcus faecium]
KVLIFVVIAVAVEVQKIVGNSIPLREIVIMFYVANEGISFLENISVFLPLPDKLKEVFQQIRNDTENKDRGGTK